jgi:hypothetical protein
VAPTSAGPSKAELKADIEARAKLREMAAVYAGILLKYSNYNNSQQARRTRRAHRNRLSTCWMP